MKFCLLTLQGTENVSKQPIKFAFFLLSADDLQNEEKVLELAPEDFALFNPNTQTCPIFRSRSDANLMRKLYQQAPVLINEKTNQKSLGDFFQTRLVLNMTSDSHLFRTRKQLETLGFELHGEYFHLR